MKADPIPTSNPEAWFQSFAENDPDSWQLELLRERQLASRIDCGCAVEKHIKLPRPGDGEREACNALAVHVVTVGGGPLAIRANWVSDPNQQLQIMAAWIAVRLVSSLVARERRKIAAVHDTWHLESAQAPIQCDTPAALKVKEPVRESRVGEVEEFIRPRIVGADSRCRLGNELLVAWQIAVAVGPGSNGPTSLGGVA